VEKLEEFLRRQRLRWLEYCGEMGSERGPVKAQYLRLDGSKKVLTKEKMERDAGEITHQMTAKDCYKRSHTSETRLQ